VADGQEEEAHDREDHLDERVRAEAYGTEKDELDELACREQVNFPLRHSSNVMRGWVRLLLGDQQQEAFNHLVPGE